MENNEVAKEKIIAARYDNNLNEMFALRTGRRTRNNGPIYSKALLEYYDEIATTIENADVEDIVNDAGRLLDR